MEQASKDPKGPLRRGWTTGACATAATRAAYAALLTGRFPDPVQITLPKGETPSFALAIEERGDGFARAGIIKDAGDDPDVTHGALIVSTVRSGAPGGGVVFRAGPGVGTVTKAGLPVAVGEPAINPVPRQMMRGVIADLANEHRVAGDVEIEISVPTGETLAAKTWNPRLGILGGLSILGTTGIVHPFSCSAWIHSIHRGIDVARAEGLTHVAGSTGSTSEAAVKALHGLPDQALIDMGDFVGGMLKHLRKHPVAQVTIAGGFGKITKLGQGMMDLHSGRSQVDFEWLAERVSELGGDAALVEAARGANTAAQVLADTHDTLPGLGDRVAALAREAAYKTLRDADIAVDVVIFDRKGGVVGRAGHVEDP
jgi:cobalt-precorrin-5B (C1)-methyltransferase